VQNTCCCCIKQTKPFGSTTYIPTYLPSCTLTLRLPDQDNRSKKTIPFPPPNNCIVYPCSPTKVHWCQSACTEKTKVKLANCTQKHGIRRFMVFRFPKAKDFQHRILARMWTSTYQLTMQDEWLDEWCVNRKRFFIVFLSHN
jgi:hypothetical protein